MISLAGVAGPSPREARRSPSARTSPNSSFARDSHRRSRMAAPNLRLFSPFPLFPPFSPVSRFPPGSPHRDTWIASPFRHHSNLYSHCNSAATKTARTSRKRMILVRNGSPTRAITRGIVRPQKRQMAAEGRINSAQNGQGCRRAGNRKSSSPARGVSTRASRNQPTPDRPNSREARMPTARARRIQSAAPISILGVYHFPSDPDNRKHRPEGFTGNERDSAGGDRGLGVREEPRNLEEATARQHGTDLGPTVTGQRQRIANTPPPVPR